ncbi:MAG: hypothetical protein P0Y53_01325 [Candidatus Pseudobacter hemicellulosilyticus]|uniref:Lipoprotein n=1 Tax=Candidatus Pseudobacter hemicellulosilyticus TaxID=3121375 RepID=A0AAJ5WT64_9BACT|nr:MAG: hypothetical protein P0Y53_01325 [Pseudobacter sp.]
MRSFTKQAKHPVATSAIVLFLTAVMGCRDQDRHTAVPSAERSANERGMPFFERVRPFRQVLLDRYQAVTSLVYTNDSTVHCLNIHLKVPIDQHRSPSHQRPAELSLMADTIKAAFLSLIEATDCPALAIFYEDLANHLEHVFRYDLNTDDKTPAYSTMETPDRVDMPKKPFARHAISQP